jgi:hypothetical protein
MMSLRDEQSLNPFEYVDAQEAHDEACAYASPDMNNTTNAMINILPYKNHFPLFLAINGHDIDCFAS